MKLENIIAVIVAIFWTCVQTNPVEVKQECGRRNVGSGLSVGGEPSKINAWPWLVAFAHRVVGNRSFFCGGSLVSAKHVVSGQNNVFESVHRFAHCESRLREIHANQQSSRSFYTIFQQLLTVFKTNGKKTSYQRVISWLLLENTISKWKMKLAQQFTKCGR